jgi:hypothetical protein
MIGVVACGARTALLAPDGVADSGADAMPVGCTPGTFALSRAQPAAMFVLDRSGSMGRAFSGPASRWEVLTSGLSKALPAVDQTIAIGALMFPSGTDTQSCSVSGTANFTPGIGHVAPLLALMTSTRPGGTTPTADAIDTAARSILAFRAATGARAMVLATDGSPNCNSALDPRTCTCIDAQTCRRATQCLDDKRTVERIASYFAQGLPTYVLGIQNPGETQNNSVLDAMADAGGRPKAGAHHFYAATSAAELDSALVAIRDQLGACTYLTTSVPSTDGTITVSVDGAFVPYDARGSTGWHWADRTNGEIVFAADVCARLSAATSIQAHVTCDAADAGADADADADGHPG